MKRVLFIVYFLYSTVSLSQVKSFSAEIKIEEVSEKSKSDGSLFIITKGGKAPFTFYLTNITDLKNTSVKTQTSPSFKDLSAGLYFVSVKDKEGNYAIVENVEVRISGEDLK